jgi:hypothetical protein
MARNRRALNLVHVFYGDKIEEHRRGRIHGRKEHGDVHSSSSARMTVAFGKDERLN